jgi:hypothetical protein
LLASLLLPMPVVTTPQALQRLGSLDDPEAALASVDEDS